MLTWQAGPSMTPRQEGRLLRNQEEAPPRPNTWAPPGQDPSRPLNTSTRGLIRQRLDALNLPRRNRVLRQRHPGAMSRWHEISLRITALPEQSDCRHSLKARQRPRVRRLPPRLDLRRPRRISPFQSLPGKVIGMLRPAEKGRTFPVQRSAGPPVGGSLPAVQGHDHAPILLVPPRRPQVGITELVTNSRRAQTGPSLRLRPVYVTRTRKVIAMERKHASRPRKLVIP